MTGIILGMVETLRVKKKMPITLSSPVLPPIYKHIYIYTHKLKNAMGFSFCDISWQF